MYYTKKEMLECPDIIKGFDVSQTKRLAKGIGPKRIIIAAMGSSFLFPGYLAKKRAFDLNIKNRLELFLASELINSDISPDNHVILLSNSGMTKEVILLQKKLKKKGVKHTAITAVPGSVLAKRCNDNIILRCGFEKGVAATKSIIEESLVLESIMINIAIGQGKRVNLGEINSYQEKAAMCMSHNITQNIKSSSIKRLIDDPMFYVIGNSRGVCEEFALKCFEIIRKPAYVYPGTSILHGAEEAIKGFPIIAVGPESMSSFTRDIQALSKRISSPIFPITCKDTKKGITVRCIDFFRDYCLLAGGWGLLLKIAEEKGIDIDHPNKIKKIGNPYKKRWII